MSIDEQWDQSDQSGLVGKTAAGRYLIVAELSADGRRTRYEAEDVEHGARVWFEVLHAKTATSDDATLRSLRHPNLVSVLDAGHLDSGEPYLASEMVRGKSLRALITAGHLEPRRALSIVRQVLQALAAAHEVGAIHGDVRPENILISIDVQGGERATLLDLGVAMLSRADRVGDPRYRAPECATGAAEPRTDLYAVGAMLFELLTDRPPFFGDDVDALIRMHAYAPVQSLRQRAPERGYTPELEELVARALAKKPDERFQSAVEMIIALDAATKSSEAAWTAAIVAKPPPPAHDASLAGLGEGLFPQAQQHSVPVVPTNTSRYVRGLPWWTRAFRLGRRPLDWFRKLDRKHRLIVAAVAGALVIALVIALVARSGGATAAAKVDADVRASPIASRARALLDAGQAKQATELIKRELVGHPDDAAAYLVLGHAQIALGRTGDGVAAYDHAIRLTPALSSDPELVANAKHALTSRDAPTALAALELLASSPSPFAQDAIVAQASTNPLADVRHRAFELAERDNIADRVDRVSSWTLDLQHAKTCDDMRKIITKLGDTGDRRALPALRQSRTHKCVATDATAAMQHITAAAKPR